MYKNCTADKWPLHPGWSLFYFPHQSIYYKAKAVIIHQFKYVNHISTEHDSYFLYKVTEHNCYSHKKQYIKDIETWKKTWHEKKTQQKMYLCHLVSADQSVTFSRCILCAFNVWAHCSRSAFSVLASGRFSGLGHSIDMIIWFCKAH